MAKGPKNVKAKRETENRGSPGATPLSEWLKDKDHVARRHDIWDLLEWHTRVVVPEIARRQSLWHRFLRLIGVEKRTPTPWELLQAAAERKAQEQQAEEAS